MIPSSCSRCPLITVRSSSVSLPHFSLILPWVCFQFPSTRFQSMSSPPKHPDPPSGGETLRLAGQFRLKVARFNGSRRTLGGGHSDCPWPHRSSSFAPLRLLSVAS